MKKASGVVTKFMFGSVTTDNKTDLLTPSQMRMYPPSHGFKELT